MSPPSAPPLAEPADVLALTVEQWVDLEPQVEIELRRKSDGLRIVFAPNKQRYDELRAQGVVVFSPREVLTLIEARADLAGDDLEDLRALVAKALEAKRALGVRIDSIIDKRGEQP